MANDTHTADELSVIKQLKKDGQFKEAFSRLSIIAKSLDDYSLQHRYVRLFQSLPKDDLDLKPIRIGIVASCSVEHFAEILRLWLAFDGFLADIYIAEFNTIEQSVLNPDSALYTFKPDIIWIFTSYRDVLVEYHYGLDRENVERNIQGAIQRFTDLWDAISRYSTSYIIQNNADLPLDRPFGHYENNAIWGRYSYIRHFNLKLSESVQSGVTIFDLDYISSVFGKRFWFDERYWFHSKHAFSLEALGLVAFQAARVIKGIKGQALKCIVLDLDNTLWGGVIGDDGLEGIRLGVGAEGEAFLDFQKYLISLKKRGVILTVCSKNEEENAKLPFLHHPEMQLALNDISVFVANWHNKADNIREIADTLEIGLDSIVFVDDNPVERKLVKDLLPMVTVTEMPTDPAKYIRAIDMHCYFETTTFSSEDSDRSEMYRHNAERKGMRRQCTDLSEFLVGLDMKAVVGIFDELNMPRISQLINKSNQFHLTTTRYTVPQIKEMMNDGNTTCLFFKLKDRFGDNGLISVVILKKSNSDDMYIDTWVMSCRVLSRGMEEFVHNELLSTAKKHNVSRLIGKFIPTSKNGLVSEHYKKLGFQLVSDQNGTTEWELIITSETAPLNTYIEQVQSY
jgi:FkbH-like protein